MIELTERVTVLVGEESEISIILRSLIPLSQKKIYIYIYMRFLKIFLKIYFTNISQYNIIYDVSSEYDKKKYELSTV